MCYYRLLSFNAFFFSPFLKSFCNEWDACSMDLNVILWNKNNKQVHCIIFKWKATASEGEVMRLLLRLFPIEPLFPKHLWVSLCARLI